MTTDASFVSPPSETAMSAAAAAGVRSEPESDSDVSMSFHLPPCFTRTGPADTSVSSSPLGSAYVVASAARADSTSIFRSCKRAISTADASSFASADPNDFPESEDVESDAEAAVSAANAAPVSCANSAVSTAIASTTAIAVRRNRRTRPLLNLL
ncbi:hypothetical protein [Streptomyces sp. YIM S03343]